MHKLKNKHTGKVIATPYMAEVEEYLNSGDYEMKNEYPYIGRNGHGVEFLVYSSGEALILNSVNRGKINKPLPFERQYKNITSEHLANTYGKCESQEHADFICKLAENHGFELNKDYTFGDYFYICKTKFGFGDWQFCSDDDAKLISLPLPPKKESKMPEEKPVYTKEMHERGEYPPIGSEVLVRYNFDSKTVTHTGKVLYVSQRHIILEIEGLDYHYKLGDYIIETLPTIEDDLQKLVRGYYDGTSKANDLASEILSKYHITPK